MKMTFLFEVIAGLPKSIILNFTQLPWNQAVKLPILVSYRTKFKSLKGKINIEGNVSFGQIRIGLSGIGSGTAHYKATVLENNGKLLFNGKVFFGGGCQICIANPSSKLSIGNQTKFMGECHIVAAKSVAIGNGCAISWNTQIMDTDFHYVYKNKMRLNEDAAIEIGDHVWIASYSLIMKGAKIPSDVVIAAGSIINGRWKDKKIRSGTLITGLPNRVLKEDITWEI